MQPTLLTTKLYFPPTRPALVSRPRLVERLQAGLRGPLTLLSAPAGSGKTTLLGEWRAGPGAAMPVAWVSLADPENDQQRFFQYLAAALDMIQPGIADQVTPLLQPSEKPETEAILTTLVNTLGQATHEFALVMDDYHVIETATIHTALTFLLEHLTPGMHVILLTRADPPLPLARLRARGQLTEIRAEHLRFSEAETAVFLNQVMGLDLNEAQVAALEKRTEGWIAGLQLAALSMQGRADVDGFVSAFTGSNHYIVDYLAEEVLNRQPEEVRNFLLKTSILERLTGTLCEALTGQAGGQETLERLAHSNLFLIPLDDEQCWFRYHHIFTDLLHSRLLHAQRYSARELHSRASEWFEANGLSDEALSHALKAGDLERAARLFCQDDLEVIYTRTISMLGHWLNAFPEEFLATNIRLCIAKAHWLHASGKDADLAPYVQKARNLLNEGIGAGRILENSPEARLIRGEILSFESLAAINRNEIPLAVELARESVDLIPETSRSRAFALGGLYVANQLTGDIQQSIQTCIEAIAIARRLNYPSMHATATYTLAQALRIQGRLHQAAQAAREGLAHVERQGQAGLFYTGFLRISLAETFYEWNALDNMEAELEAGLKTCYQGGMNILCMIGLYTKILLIRARGDIPGTFKAIDEIEHQCRHMDLNVYLEDCQYHRALLQAEQGNPARLAEWANKADLRIGQKIGVNQFGQLFRAARSLLLLNRGREVLPLLEKMGSYSGSLELRGWQLFTLVLEALAWKQQQDEGRALACLRQALDMSESEGFVRIFLNQGEAMRDLLVILQNQGGHAPFLAKLLASFPPPAGRTTPAARQEVLSRREVELLGLVAAGRSNKEIANELYISIGTVKRHTVNIFNKLDVKNRTEAVAKARELGLL